MMIQDHNRSRRKSLHSEINVTPFIDVMLVLLVIFMITSPMLLAGVQVDLPQVAAQGISHEDEPITVTIKKNGAIYLQEIVVSATELKTKLAALLAIKTDRRILIRGDVAANYGSIIEVFAALKTAGFHNVALVTELEKNGN